MLGVIKSPYIVLLVSRSILGISDKTSASTIRVGVTCYNELFYILTIFDLNVL